ncbi:MAG: hypothetical protein QG673_641 [Pseudomonadota bacterium]|nr:hypothetical protein [Pseudomonadota bacterium]
MVGALQLQGMACSMEYAKFRRMCLTFLKGHIHVRSNLSNGGFLENFEKSRIQLHHKHPAQSWKEQPTQQP